MVFRRFSYSADVMVSVKVVRIGYYHSYHALLDETWVPVGVQQKLTRHSNISTTINVYRNATIKAKPEANSKVVQMVMVAKQQQPQSEEQQIAV